MCSFITICSAGRIREWSCKCKFMNILSVRILLCAGLGSQPDQPDFPRPTVNPFVNPFVVARLPGSDNTKEHCMPRASQAQSQLLPRNPPARLQPSLSASCGGSINIEMKEVQPNPFLGVEYLTARTQGPRERV